MSTPSSSFTAPRGRYLRPYSVFGRYKRAFGGDASQGSLMPGGGAGVSINAGTDASDDEATPLRGGGRPESIFARDSLGGFSLGPEDDPDPDDDVEVYSSTRLIDPKSGEFRVLKLNRGSMWQYYMRDLFHTLVDSPWYRLIILLLVSYFIAFIVFACLYYWFTSYCANGVPTFSDAFVLSLQIHMTIGYGEYNYVPTLGCPVAITIVSLQCMTALVMSAILFGLFYARFARPSLRNQTLWFTKTAVITEISGRKYLMFRVANIRKSEIIEARVKLVLGFISKNRRGTYEYKFETLRLTHSRDIILAMPWTIVHPINKASPLYKRTQDEMRALNFEVICFIYGTNSSTGNLFEKRRSYTADEMIWNARFANILARNKRNQWVVDYGCFHRVIPQDALDHADGLVVPTTELPSLPTSTSTSAPVDVPAPPAAAHTAIPVAGGSSDDSGEGEAGGEGEGEPLSATVSPSHDVSPPLSRSARAGPVAAAPARISGSKVSPQPDGAAGVGSDGADTDDSGSDNDGQGPAARDALA